MQLCRCFCHWILNSLNESNKEAHVKQAASSDNWTQASVRLLLWPAPSRLTEFSWSTGPGCRTLSVNVTRLENVCHSKQELWTRTQKIGRQRMKDTADTTGRIRGLQDLSVVIRCPLTLPRRERDLPDLVLREKMAWGNLPQSPLERYRLPLLNGEIKQSPWQFRVFKGSMMGQSCRCFSL